MEIHRWKIDPSRLQKMPSNERALFFLLGHAINEISGLTKLFYLSNQYDHTKEWLRHAHLAQGMLLARTLLGKLDEAWKLLGVGYYESALAKEYEELLTNEALAALKELGKHFGKGSFINSVRNSFSFHYSIAEINAVLSGDLNEDELVSYMAESGGNTVHYFSEYAINLALLNSIDKDDARAAMERLMDESTDVVRLFNESAKGIMIVIAERYLTTEQGALNLEAIDIGDVPLDSDLAIPFFFRTTNLEKPEMNVLPDEAINSDPLQRPFLQWLRIFTSEKAAVTGRLS